MSAGVGSYLVEWRLRQLVLAPTLWSGVCVSWCWLLPCGVASVSTGVGSYLVEWRLCLLVQAHPGSVVLLCGSGPGCSCHSRNP
jgi:hypothetical protein